MTGKIKKTASPWSNQKVSRAKGLQGLLGVELLVIGVCHRGHVKPHQNPEQVLTWVGGTFRKPRQITLLIVTEHFQLPLPWQLGQLEKQCFVCPMELEGLNLRSNFRLLLPDVEPLPFKSTCNMRKWHSTTINNKTVTVNSGKADSRTVNSKTITVNSGKVDSKTMSRKAITVNSGKMDSGTMNSKTVTVNNGKSGPQNIEQQNNEQWNNGQWNKIPDN